MPNFKRAALALESLGLITVSRPRFTRWLFRSWSDSLRQFAEARVRAEIVSSGSKNEIQVQRSEQSGHLLLTFCRLHLAPRQRLVTHNLGRVYTFQKELRVAESCSCLAARRFRNYLEKFGASLKTLGMLSADHLPESAHYASARGMNLIRR